MATLPGAWRYRASIVTGWPGISILWLGEVESLICNFCPSVAARTIVWADPSMRYTSMLLGYLTTNQETKCSRHCTGPPGLKFNSFGQDMEKTAVSTQLGLLNRSVSCMWALIMMHPSFFKWAVCMTLLLEKTPRVAFPIAFFVEDSPQALLAWTDFLPCLLASLRQLIFGCYWVAIEAVWLNFTNWFVNKPVACKRKHLGELGYCSLVRSASSLTKTNYFC